MDRRSFVEADPSQSQSCFVALTVTVQPSVRKNKRRGKWGNEFTCLFSSRKSILCVKERALCRYSTWKVVSSRFVWAHYLVQLKHSSAVQVPRTTVKWHFFQTPSHHVYAKFWVFVNEIRKSGYVINAVNERPQTHNKTHWQETLDKISTLTFDKVSTPKLKDHMLLIGMGFDWVFPRTKQDAILYRWNDTAETKCESSWRENFVLLGRILERWTYVCFLIAVRRLWLWMRIAWC